MFEQFHTMIHQIVGDHPVASLSCMHMITRGVIIYIYGIILVRMHERFFGMQTTHDILLRVTIGSIFAGCIIGAVPFLCSFGITLALVLLNWLVAVLSFRSKRFEKWVKGSHYLLIDDGNIVWKNMRKFYITKDELLETARISAHTQNLEDIDKAYLENHGEITLILKKKPSTD